MSGSDKPPSSPRPPSVTNSSANTSTNSVSMSHTRTVSSPTQTECSGSEPYYNVPVLQNVVSAAPGVTSRLYSVQVMTKSELDSLTQFQRQQLQQRQHSQQQTVSPCDSAMCSFNNDRSRGPRSDDNNYPSCDSTSSDNTSSSSSHSRQDKSDKPVNLSSKK